MSQEVVKIPTAFQNSVQAIYGGQLIVGRCHQADSIRHYAEQAFRENDYSRELVGDRLYRLTSRGKVFGRIGEDEVVFGAMTEMTGTRHIPRISPGLSAKRVQSLLPQAAINLTINNNWGTPAAIILPSIHPESSASVIVGEELNNPNHLDELEFLMSWIGTRSTFSIDQYDRAMAGETIEYYPM